MGDVDALDLAFVVDTTGSMGGFIAAAQHQMLDMIEGLARAAAVDMRLGVVEYRDHPPQDRMVFRVHHFTDGVKRAQKTVMHLRAEGGGDAPEAEPDLPVDNLAGRLGERRHRVSTALVRLVSRGLIAVPAGG
jgi:hypothetical protein